MEILNIGPLELIIILVLMFIILGPKDMVRTAQRIGSWVRSITRSQMWREVWGISQDIRELPKKLMEETGLEEALTDVKNTTQEVTNELNAQIKEATEAARVQEIEHMRVENPLMTPPPDSVPAALPSALQSPVNLDAVQPAELKVAATTAEEAAAAAMTVPVIAEAVPAKKSRRKKVAPVDPLAEPDEPFWPDTPFFSLESTDQAALPGNGKASAEAEPVAQPRPRKRRAVQPGAEESAGVESPTGEPESGNGTVKPARPRKPRQPKAAPTETTAPEAGTVEAVPAPVESEAISAKTAVAKTAVAETARAETNGAVIYEMPAVESEASTVEATAPEASSPYPGAPENGAAEIILTDTQPEAQTAASNGNGKMPEPLPQPDQDAAQLDRDAA